MERVREFTYLGDRVSRGGGCEAAVTASRCGWFKLRECSELLYGRIFPLRLKGAVYKYSVRPTILCGSEVFCLKECEMVILWAERSMVRAVFEVQIKEEKRM